MPVATCQLGAKAGQVFPLAPLVYKPTGVYTQEDRQEGLSLPTCLSLPDAVAVCAFTGMLQREASGVKTGIFYETKPTNLLESTEVLQKKFEKSPEKPTEVTNRGVMQWLLERFGRCKSGMASNPYGLRKPFTHNLLIWMGEKH